MLTHDVEAAEEVIHVRIPAELRRRLEAYCAHHGDTVEDLVTRAIWEELAVLSGDVLPSRPNDSPIDPMRDYAIDEVIDLCRDQWVLMGVTSYDERHNPAKGVVLAHSFRRADISRALAQEPPFPDPSSDAPRRPYYIFRAFPRIESGPEIEGALADLVAHAGRHLRVTEDTSGSSDAR